MNHVLTSRFYKYFVQVLLFTGLTLTGVKHSATPVAVSAPSHIVFIEDSFDEALKQGRLQNKYIFVDAYATWCGPCKMLKARTFADSKAAEFYNKTFVNVSIDMEKGQGPQLARQWQLTAYPTLIIFDPKGKPVLGSVGYIGASDLIKFGQQALKK
ncbi:thioredoxin family protein [Mucilaginibacter sp. BJC16-A38]|uniref:thioredoxin family protein n=1 Tax=Mucilaginibacter phenanthrenivorans TaxID=1234842 RepID=UPI00215723B6|nr:thioredoxin domain-containing protein [Mucilaginibacter phenanthrenivorans]MCR8557016.1 thioredoxin family protein [Mucilaginibacter phenanthrenivorans]